MAQIVLNPNLLIFGIISINSFIANSLFIKRSFCKSLLTGYFYKRLCLTVPLLFMIYLLFFLCLISVCFTCSCIYVSHGFILCFLSVGGGGGEVWTSYTLTDCLPSNCKKQYLLTYLLKKHHHTHLCLQTSLISCCSSFLERDLPKYRCLLGNIHTTQK